MTRSDRLFDLAVWTANAVFAAAAADAAPDLQPLAGVAWTVVALLAALALIDPDRS